MEHLMRVLEGTLAPDNAVRGAAETELRSVRSCSARGFRRRAHT